MNEQRRHEVEAIGARLRALREHRNWSIRAVARRAGLSHAQVGKLELGQGGRPQPSTLASLARAFGWDSWEALMATDALEPPETVLPPLVTLSSELLEAVHEWSQLWDLAARRREPNHPDLHMASSHLLVAYLRWRQAAGLPLTPPEWRADAASRDVVKDDPAGGVR